MENSPQIPLRVALIGGGPSGLMAAERLATAGFAVTVYDAMPTLGRKFLMAGRGGLNITHSEDLPVFLTRYGAAAEWIAPVLRAFPPAALRAWCAGLGIETFVGSSGRIFPKEMKASPLLRAWLRRLESLGVRQALRHRWCGWTPSGALQFETPTGLTEVTADAVLLALGGASWPKLGSDGTWVEILRGQGVDITPLRPANCGFIVPWSDNFSARFAGQPLKPVAFTFGDQTRQGEAMISERGLEGSLTYAFSAALRDAIEAQGKAVLSLDLRPGVATEKLAAQLSKPRGSQSASTFAKKAGGLSSLGYALLREAVGETPLPQNPDALAALIKNVPLTLTATTGIARAISSAGGVDLGEVDATLMLKKKPGVFIAGEMLNWEAPTGGYLLQGSFSLAVAAANGITAYLKGN